MIIKSANIEQFRAMKNLSIRVGKNLTCICGVNGTMKTTLMGILAQPFSCKNDSNNDENDSIINLRTIEGYTFESKFKDKFRISEEYDKIGSHKWTMYFEEGFSKENITLSSQPRKEKGKVNFRFWNSESREKGAGNVIAPVYYLSLSRTFPIGEISKEKNISMELTSKEQDFYIENYKKILNIHIYDEEMDVQLKNKNKSISFTGIKTSNYDVNSSSSGENIIGRILLAILSFKRLKEQSSDYKAGILFIDEIETALYPSSQRELINFLSKVSKDYNIQIIFTTHSPIILESVNTLQRNSINKKEKAYNNENEIICLKKEDGVVKSEMINNSNDLKKLLNELEQKSTINEYNIRIYTEDYVAQQALKIILKYSSFPNIIDKLNFQDIALGCDNYITLVKKDFGDIKNSIIVLDADVEDELKEGSNKKEVFDKNDNLLLLPVTVEKDMFKFFYNNREAIKSLIQLFIEENPNGNISYEIIFKGYTNSNKEYNTNECKKWYNKIKKEDKITDEMLLTVWAKLDKNNKKIKEFINKFELAYNEIADRLNMDKIYF